MYSLVLSLCSHDLHVTSLNNNYNTLNSSRLTVVNVAGDSPVWYQLLPSFPPALYMATIIDRGWFGRCAGLIGW